MKENLTQGPNLDGFIDLISAVFWGMIGWGVGNLIGASLVLSASVNYGYWMNVSEAQGFHTFFIWVGLISGAVYGFNALRKR